MRQYFATRSHFARKGGARRTLRENIVKLISKRMREFSLRLSEKPNDIIPTFGFAQRSLPTTFN